METRNSRQWTSRFGERNAYSQHGAAAVGQDAHGHQHGTIDDAAAVTDFFVAGIQQQIRELAQGPRPPRLEFFVQELRGSTHLAAGDLQATKFASNLGDFASRDPLDVHLGDRQLEGPFATNAPLERLGIELDAASLRNGQLQRADARSKRLGLKSVGVAATLVGPFVRLGAERFAPLDLHRLVEQNLQGAGQAVETMFVEDLDHLVKRIKFQLVGHAWVSFRLLGNKRLRDRPWPTLSSGPPGFAFFATLKRRSRELLTKSYLQTKWYANI
jgi:hypothetical protein